MRSTWTFLDVWRPLLVALPFLFAAPVMGQGPFTINGRLKMEGGGTDDARVVVYRDGEQHRVITDNLSKFSLELDLNANYILSFEKEGFVTKKLSFNTRVPAEAAANGFTPFDFAVSLFKQYDGVNTVVFNQPVGMIRYDRTMDDFDYDTDYTKSIQSALEKAQEEVLVKQEEERANAEASAKRKAEEDKAKAKADEEARKQAAEQAKSEAKRKEEAELAKAAEDARKANEAREAAEAARKAERAKAAEEARNKAKPVPKEVPPPPVQAKVEPKPKPRPVPVKAAVVNALKAPAHDGNDIRRGGEPIVQNEASPVQPARANTQQEPRPKFAPSVPEPVRYEELIVEPSQVVTLIRLENGTGTTEYRKVVRKYSGTFYFKNGQSCTRSIYELEALVENR